MNDDNDLSNEEAIKPVSENAEKIKTVISEMLGVDAEEIQDEDFLRDDLHMSANDLTDLSSILSKNGFDISDLSFKEIETVEELIDNLEN